MGAIPETPLKINGDYQAGTYTFVGSVGYPLGSLYLVESNLYLIGFNGYKVTLQIK